MPLDLSRIKALCFDVDGTLSDTDDLYVRDLTRLLPRFLFRDPQRVARRLVMWMEAPGNALLTLADTLGVDDEISALLSFLARLRKRSRRSFLLVPGVDAMLKELHGRYPMAVVSARDEQGTMAFLERFDLARYFSAIVTGLSARHTKPYPDPVILAAQRMGVAPQDCLMIGDTVVDIRAGKAAGAQTAGVLCGFGERAELEKMGADMILEDTTKLLKALGNQQDEQDG